LQLIGEAGCGRSSLIPNRLTLARYHRGKCGQAALWRAQTQHFIKDNRT
jgi:hypothetical protein